jgi:hypothetical protein
MRSLLCGTAGIFLAVFLIGCEESFYRLEGVAQTQQIALLDSTTRATMDSFQVQFDSKIEGMARAELAAIDSTAKSASAMRPTIRKAQKSVESAREKYGKTFQRIRQFRSFGGNPVFSEEDAGVATETLLKEIPSRFYKGRAFSLETEGKIRNFVREELVPLEIQVKNAQRRVGRLKNAQVGRSKSAGEISGVFHRQRSDLQKTTLKDMRAALFQHQIGIAEADEDGQYAFNSLRTGQYYLVAGDRDSIDYLVSVLVVGHARQNISPAAGSPLFAPTKPEPVGTQ